MSPPFRPAGFNGRFLTDTGARCAYSEGAGPFRIVPAAVAIPAHREDVCLILQYAADAGIPVHPRGAGSGIPGGNLGPGIVLDLSVFDRPARVALAQTANVGAAVTWGTIDQVAAHFGFRLPPNPSSGAFCTVGGMVATNAAGARSLSVGSIRHWVRGVEFVTVDGEAGWLERAHASRTHPVRTPPDRRQLVERLAVQGRFEPVRSAVEAAALEIAERFPRTRKNASGYALDEYLASGSLLDLVIGSEGTLGVVTRAELQLQRVPEHTGTLLLGLASLDGLAEVVAALTVHRPSVIELLDSTLLAFLPDETTLDLGDVSAVLLVEFERREESSVREALAAARHAVADACPLAHSGVSEAERAALWAIRHLASSALASLPQDRRSLQIVEDGCVPPSSLDAYLRGVRQLAGDLGIPVVAFGHAGDGHLHVNALVDTTESDFEHRLASLLEATTSLVIELGGTPSGEHGDGRLRARAVGQVYGPIVTELFERVKRAFDPAGILNPGVIVPTNGERSLADLKVGPTAAEIPAPIAKGLRTMEQTGGWGASPIALIDTEP